jgi:hypothetical protein
LMENIENK